MCGPYVGRSTGEVPGEVDNGEVECVRGECNDVSAAEVAPPVAGCFEEVVIERGCEGCDEVACCVVCVVEEEGVAVVVAFPCGMAVCARKAARKFDRKGR